MDWEFGIRICKLIYIEQINNKVLLYSTGNYIQHPVINHNGKEFEKECRFPQWLCGKESAGQCRRHRFNPWSRKIPLATKPVATTAELALWSLRAMANEPSRGNY